MTMHLDYGRPMSGWSLVPRLFDPGTLLALALFIFSLWVPCLIADLVDRRAS